MDASDYVRRVFPTGSGRLLRMAGLPLLDGFYLAFLAGGLYEKPAAAVAFGLTAFSGAGCVIAAMNLTGPAVRRLAQVVAVYAGITLVALAISLALPTFESILPANLSLFTAIFLIGLGLDMTGVPRLARFANWLGFKTVLKIMLVASLLTGLCHGVAWQLTPDGGIVRGVLLAVVAGTALSLGGALLGLLVRAGVDRRFLDWGAGLSLVLMGLTVLGLPVPSAYVIAPLAVGLAGTLVSSLTRRPGRPRSG